ncbi:YopX family protein [Bacillus changyiensis]|uniref:YopX family protein n=1 Tax=Bacillus changyiensis TaxID=3004103 RepID=UPI0022E690BF|nr:YopX family protein [Bacillus changyiensis]MDA1478437.1 YopX family protein [Bacillus changyiensis]
MEMKWYSIGQLEARAAAELSPVFSDEYELISRDLYTGLKDKNFHEIYEGDILSTDLTRPYLIVEFRNGAFMVQCHDGDEDYYDYILPVLRNSSESIKYHEVIGNIYENPDLLEDTK